MAQFSMEIMRLTGSVLRGNQHSPPDRARELIEHDDEREPAFGIGGPVAEISCGSFGSELRKAGLNFAVRAATHSPEPVISMDLRVYL